MLGDGNYDIEPNITAAFYFILFIIYFIAFFYCLFR